MVHFLFYFFALFASLLWFDNRGQQVWHSLEKGDLGYQEHKHLEIQQLFLSPSKSGLCGNTGSIRLCEPTLKTLGTFSFGEGIPNA